MPTARLRTRYWPGPSQTKSAFFAEKDASGNVIDYHAAVAGKLQLIPVDEALTKLETDYHRMVEDGLFLDDVEPFVALLARCKIIQNKANSTSQPGIGLTGGRDLIPSVVMDIVDILLSADARWAHRIFN